VKISSSKNKKTESKPIKKKHNFKSN